MEASQKRERNRWTEGLATKTKLVILAAAIILLTSGSIIFYALNPHSSPQQISQSTQSTQIFTTSNSSTTAYFTKYLGYIPSGYSVASRLPSAPVFPCPSGMSSTQCSLFQQTCGNGVCDPNERCNTCPFDCPVTGALVCDPYTGRPSAPASVCQITPQQPPTQTSG
jgi:hypothetical protein